MAKFNIKQKITFCDANGPYAVFKKGRYETQDETEIKLLEGSENAESINAGYNDVDKNLAKDGSTIRNRKNDE